MTDLERRQALYDFLVERGDKWTAQERVTAEIPAYPAVFTSSYHNSSARRILSEDIQWINSPESGYSKIIISGSNGIKLANRQEISRFIRTELSEVFSKLKRIRYMQKRIGLDGQIGMDGSVIDAFLESADEAGPEEN